MRWMTLFTILGPIVQATASSITALSFGRVISGLGSGGAIVVAPIYTSEISPPRLRGLFGTVTQIMINFGILIAQLLGYFLSKGDMWRIILAVAGGIAVLQLLTLLILPESPKWLAEQRRVREARDILRRFRGAKADLEEELRDLKLDQHEGEAGTSMPSLCDFDLRLIIASTEGESLLAQPDHAASKEDSHQVGMLQAFTDPFYRPALFAVVLVMVAQQLTGMNSVIMYSVDTLSSLLPTTAALLTVLISVLNIVVTTACAPLSDVIGRKTCLLLSTAGMGLSSVLLAAGLGKEIKPLTAAAALLFVASFAVGLGPVPFMLASELVGPEAVGAAQGWALAANWISCFLISQFFPIIYNALGRQGRGYIVFAGVALVFGVLIAWRVPETKGKKNADEVWGRKDTRERLE